LTIVRACGAVLLLLWAGWCGPQPVEDRILRLANLERQKHGAPKLNWDDKLAEAARRQPTRTRSSARFASV
jgi:hypothetical protein